MSYHFMKLDKSPPEICFLVCANLLVCCRVGACWSCLSLGSKPSLLQKAWSPS